ncbi:hypothetical protein CISIN_1g045486mg, partial [Citrus sinensis]
MSLPSKDPSDPLFIHAFDHPGMILVPKVLDGTNYPMWRRSILISLSAKNKLGFIPTPNETDATYQIWQRCNDMVLSWIFNSLSPNLPDNAFWDELKMSTPLVPYTCGGMKHLNDRDEKVMLKQFLMGLNETYSA